MTEVIDRGHSFISHRDHRGHKILIPDKSGLRGQSKSNPVSTGLSLEICPEK